jgi:hypothetical protein
VLYENCCSYASWYYNILACLPRVLLQNFFYKNSGKVAVKFAANNILFCREILSQSLLHPYRESYLEFYRHRKIFTVTIITKFTTNFTTNFTANFTTNFTANLPRVFPQIYCNFYCKFTVSFITNLSQFLPWIYRKFYCEFIAVFTQNLPRIYRICRQFTAIFTVSIFASIYAIFTANIYASIYENLPHDLFSLVYMWN